MICRTNNYLIIPLFTIIISLVLSSPARAQQAPQPQVEKAVEVTTRDVQKRAQEKLTPVPKKKPEIEEVKPEKEEDKRATFNVTKINLLGAKSLSPDKYRPIIEEYENRAVTFDELSVLAKKIERAYLKEGIVAACFVPPQEIESGIPLSISGFVTLRGHND